MVETNGNGAALEFMGLSGEESAQVRDGPNVKILPLSDLRAMLPTSQNDLVIPIIGEMRGVLFKVKLYGTGTCVAHQPATRLKKGEVDPSFATSELVQVFPPFNRKSRF